MKKLFLLGKSVFFFFLKSGKLNQMLWDAVKSDDLETAYVVLKAGANVYDFHTSRWLDPADPDGICTIEKKVYPLGCARSEEMKKLLNYFGVLTDKKREDKARVERKKREKKEREREQKRIARNRRFIERILPSL